MQEEPTRLVLRRCPECRRPTDALLCPRDGTATLLIGLRPKHPSEVEAGTIVAGRYRVERVLGGGGFATVFAAKHLATGGELALKVLAADEEDETTLLRFFQEARVTASLQHPHTVRVFDVGQDDSGIIFLAMELLAGETLGALYRRRKREDHPFSEIEIIDLMIPIAKSLTEAHARGLVHRDLKPDNVMLHEVIGDDPIVKVVDFGIAKLRGKSLTTAASSPLTPEYASPEQVGATELDARSDLYSIGVIMYQLAAFDVPFRGDNPLSTMYMHFEQPPPPLADRAKSALSPAFIDLVMRLLEKSPDDRPVSAAALREALDGLKRGDARKQTPSEAPTKPPSTPTLKKKPSYVVGQAIEELTDPASGEHGPETTEPDARPSTGEDSTAMDLSRPTAVTEVPTVAQTSRPPALATRAAPVKRGRAWLVALFVAVLAGVGALVLRSVLEPPAEPTVATPPIAQPPKVEPKPEPPVEPARLDPPKAVEAKKPPPAKKAPPKTKKKESALDLEL